MPRRKKQAIGDREISRAPFVEGKGGVHGTPSNVERTSYAASSVIERGTAAKLATGRAESNHQCACGCGQEPSLGDSLFVPGHDSKVRAMGKAVKEGRIKKTALPKIAREYLEQGGML